VLASVAPAEAGIASGVNNTVARMGTVLAVAVVGLVAVALYGRALERRLAVAGVPADVARVLVSERRSLDVTIPESVPPAERAVLAANVSGAFLTGFRGAVLLCAAIVLVGAAFAADAIKAIDSTAAREGPSPPTCEHVDRIANASPRSRGCEECLLTGDTWVHLRVCLTCGQVGCCDSSKNRHATRHFWASQHPIVGSLEPGETWRWCYIDETVA